MGAAVMSAPGSEYGPCENEACEHSDCAASRRMASTVCPVCSEPIGYERLFYISGDRVLSHQVCLELQVEAERAR